MWGNKLMRFRLPFFLATFALLSLGFTLFSTNLVQSQTDTNSCLAYLETALERVGDNCGELGRNTACYGYRRVDASFVTEVDTDLFSKPTDRTEITSLQTISTAPLDIANDQWGITVMAVQANVPDTLPGQNVRFFLFGDVSVENAVPANEAFQPLENPITVTTHTDSIVRSAPGRNANFVTNVPGGVGLPADGISEDGDWLRITVDAAQVGWINAGIVDIPEGGLEALPTISGERRTPMQAFYLKTSLNQSNCVDAPSLLVVQGPKDFVIDLQVNGVDIRLASTVVFRLTATSTMQVTTIDGSVRVDGISVAPGLTISAPLTADGRGQGGPVTGLHALNADELREFTILESIPVSVLNYAITLPTLEQIQALEAAFGSGSGPVGRTSGTAAGRLSCSRLRLTSPLEGWGPNFTTFYWDAAPGATSYRLFANVPGGAREQLAETTATNATVNLVGFYPSETIDWQVEALVNGETACLAGPITIRYDGSAPPTGGRPCPATGGC